MGDYIYLVIVLAVALVSLVVGLVTTRLRRHRPTPTRPTPTRQTTTGPEAPSPTVPADQDRDGSAAVDAPYRPGADTFEGLPEPAAPVPTIERPESAQGRLIRLRARLARSQSSLGQGLLALLSRDRIDEDTWDEIEDTLLVADVGVAPAQELVERLRTRVRVEGVASGEAARAMLRGELLALVDPSMDRALRVSRRDGLPGVVMVVGVNGTGKTTTVGKLARVLVAEDRDVLLGAADTFRAAAVDQLQTWGERVGVPTVRGPEGGDPASVAFDAVRAGVEQEVDTVLIDTAGRLHTKTGLMDELGKIKRVIEKQAPVTEVLLVLDATTGQNGLVQARVFREVVDVSGIVLTKLDGSAKGGIVLAIQTQLGIPVKLVGLGETADDLVAFDADEFVDALFS